MDVRAMLGDCDDGLAKLAAALDYGGAVRSGGVGRETIDGAVCVFASGPHTVLSRREADSGALSSQVRNTAKKRVRRLFETQSDALGTVLQAERELHRRYSTAAVVHLRVELTAESAPAAWTRRSFYESP